MNFKGLHFACDSHLSDLLVAELSMLRYDSFEEHQMGFSAYCEVVNFNQPLIDSLVQKYQKMGNISYTLEAIARINWNTEWEKNYDAVVIADKIMIRAIFHEPQDHFKHQIVIHPKMSFGTGHHATTSLILETQLSIDHHQKKIYDFGTGTGVLSILAHQLGARQIVATDVDDWCIENAEENFNLNDCPGRVLKGVVRDLTLKDQADIVIANINKNVLLKEMSEYVRLLTLNGILILSGFYEKDAPEICACAEKLGLKQIQQKCLNLWMVIVLSKRT
jgi:ribosomal protein L11 methyltransferase|tara:strand:- start:5552 stop:6382 length:831 start_codon:yes stop_codon:yes gene_type:complete